MARRATYLRKPGEYKKGTGHRVRQVNDLLDIRDETAEPF